MNGCPLEEQERLVKDALAVQTMFHWFTACMLDNIDHNRQKPSPTGIAGRSEHALGGPHFSTSTTHQWRRGSKIYIYIYNDLKLRTKTFGQQGNRSVLKLGMCKNLLASQRLPALRANYNSHIHM